MHVSCSSVTKRGLLCLRLVGKLTCHVVFFVFFTLLLWVAMLNEKGAINTTLGCTSWSITFLFNSFQCPNEEVVDSD